MSSVRDSPDAAQSRAGPANSAIGSKIVFAGGFALLFLHALRYGIADPSAIDASLLTAPVLAKLLDVVSALGGLAVIDVAAYSLGSVVESILPPSPALRDLRSLHRVGIGLALLGFGVLALGALHLLTRAALFALLLAAIAAGAPAAWRAWCARAVRPGGARPSSWAPWMVLGYGILLAAGFLDALDHDPGWDAQTYHLAFPQQYLFTNGIFMTPFSHLSGYIVNTEMLYTLGLGIQGQQLAVLIHFQFGVLCLAAVWLLARRASLRAAFIAPLFLLADPLFNMELGMAYADLALAFYTTLAAVALFHWMRDEGDSRALLYAGVFAGLCASVRYLGVGYVGVLCISIWLPPRHRRIEANLGAFLRVGGIALLVMSPWLLRNAVFTGNPITPLVQSLFHAPGKEYIPPIVIEQSTSFLRRIGMGSDLGALLLLPWNLTIASTPGVYTDSFGCQVTPLYVAAGAAAVVALSGRRGPHAPLIRFLLALVALSTVFWFYSFQEARFLLPIFPLLCVAGALAIDALIEAGSPWSRALVALPVAGALYYQLLIFGRVPSLWADAVGVIDPASWSTRGAPAAASYLRGALGPDDRLMLFMEERGLFFEGIDYLPYHTESGGPSLQLIHGYKDPRSLRCGLAELGVTYLLFNRNNVDKTLFVPGYAATDYAADLQRLDRMLKQYASPVFERDSVEVHRLGHADCD